MSLCLTICYIISFLLFVIWIQTHLVPVFFSFLWTVRMYVSVVCATFASCWCASLYNKPINQITLIILPFCWRDDVMIVLTSWSQSASSLTIHQSINQSINQSLLKCSSVNNWKKTIQCQLESMFSATSSHIISLFPWNSFWKLAATWRRQCWCFSTIAEIASINFKSRFAVSSSQATRLRITSSK